MPVDLKRIHIWAPNLFGFKGGIQVYSAYFLNALQDLTPNCEHSVFLMHDVAVSSQVHCQSTTQFHFAGRFPHRLRNPLYAAQLMGYGIMQRPNLIITTHLNFTPIAYRLKCLLGIPYWTVAHGVEAWGINRPILQTALQHADRILPVSSYTRDRLLQEQRLDPEQFSVLPNTVDTERFRLGPKPTHLLTKYGLAPQQPVILTVNRLCASESYKSYDQVLKALPYIRQQVPNIRYLIVGKGDDRPRLETYIQAHHLDDCVTLGGFVPDAELCDYYNLCDIFAMPSKLEGFGIVYLEAMACGKPVLGGNQDGAIDALCGGRLGVLVDPDDIPALANTLVQILQKKHPNPLLYHSEALRQSVIDTYGIAVFRQKISKLLVTHS